MNLLILGGTNDALRLSDRLHQKGVSVIYSLAGLVRVPERDYQVVTGGFSQYGGLSSFIGQHAIAGILDATHPYANIISDTAYKAADVSRVPYWQFDRSAWEKQANDNWFEYENWDQLCSMLGGKKSVFITTGQLDTQTLDSLSTKLTTKILIRTAIKPAAAFDSNLEVQAKIQWIQAIGPFTLEQEINLMQEYDIDALVSKNSGGDATVSKLHAARQLLVPVYLLKRPEYQRFQGFETGRKLDVQNFFSDAIMCEDVVLAHFNEISTLLLKT